MPALRLRWLAVFLLAGLCSGGLGWAATGVTLTVDCPLCGPGQPYPHVCPLANSSAALAATEAFPGWVETARKESRRLRALNGFSIPELGEVGNVTQLYAALSNLIVVTEDEIARCEREYADYQRRRASGDAEKENLHDAVRQLTAEVAESRAAVAATEAETAAEIQGANRARDEIIALQKSLNQVREEVRQVRNRLFPQLHQAALRGWILPPSSYRPMPVPLSPRTALSSPLAGDLAPGTSAGPAFERPSDMNTFTLRAGPGPALRSSAGAQPLTALAGAALDVPSKLEQLAGLWERARTAAARREEAIRALEQQRGENENQSARLSTLQPQRTVVAGQLAFVRRNLTIARETHADYRARVASARAAAVQAWIEWGIFQMLERKTGTLPTGAESRSVEPTVLDAWREVAALAVQLGSDPVGAIARFPASPLGRGESLRSLQRDLAAVREKFGLGFAVAGADLPDVVQPYLSREGP